jgi:hypothetical protein
MAQRLFSKDSPDNRAIQEYRAARCFSLRCPGLGRIEDRLLGLEVVVVTLTITCSHLVTVGYGHIFRILRKKSNNYQRE